jgi:hypothetical protein
MSRKLSGKKYLLAFILTLLIFSGGIIVGILFENVRLNDSNQINLQEKVNLRSLQLQQSYIESGIAECNALNDILEANIAELSKKVQIISGYEKKSVLNDHEFNLQLRDYFLTEIQFLLISQEIDNKCKRDNIRVIFFYDENKFDTQGQILDYLKDLFGRRLLIFSFDSQFKDEPMINLLLTSYKIKQFPAVVVEDKILQGHTSVDILMKEICSRMEGKLPKECENLS